MELSPDDIRRVEAFCRDELSSYLLYLELAEAEKPPLSEQLRRSAEQERSHYEFWRSVLGRDCRASRPPRLFRRLCKLFGPVLTLRLLQTRY